jgi:hypothetical protein
MRLSHTHIERIAIRERLHAIREAHNFDDRGICTDHGKFEGCYEATVYFHDMGLDGDYGEGLITFPDGSSECAYKVSEMERAMLAGPWDHDGHVSGILTGFLYVIVEGADGGLVSSHSDEATWAERLSGMDQEEV